MDWLRWLPMLPVLAASLWLHEWAHVFMIRYHGIHTEGIRLHAAGLVARARPLDELTLPQRATVYLAGPVANALVAGWTFTVHTLSYVGVNWLYNIALINIVLCVFNLLPLLPLDGGRVLQLAMGHRMGIGRANRLLLRISRRGAVALMALGLVQVVFFPFNITLFVAGVFIWRQSKVLPPVLFAENLRALHYKPRLFTTRTPPATRVLRVPAHFTVGDALAYLCWRRFCVFWVAGHSHPIGEDVVLSFVSTPGLPLSDVS